MIDNFILRKVLTPHNSVPMCSCIFRYPVKYDKLTKEIRIKWENFVGPTSYAQIKRLIYFRGLASFLDNAGNIDIESYILTK